MLTTLETNHVTAARQQGADGRDLWPHQLTTTELVSHPKAGISHNQSAQTTATARLFSEEFGEDNQGAAAVQPSS